MREEDQIDMMHDGHALWQEIDRLRAELAQRTAELAALKAQPDPLAEMWAALAEYQPQADRDGHGESWRRMCSERTGDAAWEAKLEARRSSTDSAWAAADAQEAIDAIRRAKEVKR